MSSTRRQEILSYSEAHIESIQATNEGSLCNGYTEGASLTGRVSPTMMPPINPSCLEY
jgi:hypothetical protein